MTVMKNVNRYSLVLLLLCVATPLLYPQKVGSTSMQFLKVIPSARGAALGDAYSVLASGADAVFWNPSGLAAIKDQELSSTYIQWIFDTRQGAAAYGITLGEFGTVAAQIQYVDFGEFLEASMLRPYINKEIDPGLTGNTFHPFSYLIGISYAQNLTDKFSTGVSIKYAHESLYNGAAVMTQVSQGVDETVNTWADGLMFDFGFHYKTGFRSIELAAAVQNFGGDVTYAKESNPLPMMFRWGIAANLVGTDAIAAYDETNRIGFAFDLFQPNDYAQQAHMGLEYEYAGVFALRSGYKFNYDSEGLTLGSGIRQSFGPVLLKFDYSFSSVGTYLGNVHRFSLGAVL